ncbi:MAG: terminase large subunit [Xanthobacteraceae bacterium]|nr:terminase large subunit [Xanthobacteraceae bacterium]
MTKTRSTFPDWIYDGSEIPDPFGYGERAVRFLRALKHPKSRLPKKAFQLDPWQERIVRRIYGPCKEDGTRIVSSVVILVPRGNRKSSLAAALALLHTIGPERVSGGEAVFAASNRKQAAIAFREARSIVQADDRVSSHVKIYDAHNSAKKITYPADATELEIISSDAPAAEGRTLAFALLDEIHVFRGSDLYKVVTNGLDKVDNSLLAIATTAGRGQENIAFEVIERARKVARGEIDDPSLLPVLFESPADVNIASESAWRRVNPGVDHGYPSIDGFRRHVARAKDSPIERESLLQYKFNVWLDHSTSPFVDMAVYDKGNRPIPDDIDGLPCWIGADISVTTDLTAVVACIPYGDDYIILPHFFCPAENLRAKGEQDGAPYLTWAEQGYLTGTPGNVIDPRMIEAHIRALCDRFDVREIGFDRARAQAVMGPLMDDGLPVIEISQQWQIQTPALDTLERVIIQGHFVHAGNPVLRWCFSNIAVHHWGNSNRAFRKDKSVSRIDGAVASWMAVSRAVAGDTGISVYSTDDRPEGILVI